MESTWEQELAEYLMACAVDLAVPSDEAVRCSQWADHVRVAKFHLQEWSLARSEVYRLQGVVEELRGEPASRPRPSNAS